MQRAASPVWDTAVCLVCRLGIRAFLQSDLAAATARLDLSRRFPQGRLVRKVIPHVEPAAEYFEFNNVLSGYRRFAQVLLALNKVEIPESDISTT